MVRDFYASDGPDFLEINALRTEANYYDEVAAVRASYIGKLLEHDAIQGGFGLAVFNIVDIPAGNIAIDENPKDMFVWMKRPDDSPPGGPPNLRIFTNESFIVDGACRVLTYDISIDPEGDSQLLIDAYEVDVTGDSLKPKPMVEQSKQLDGVVQASRCTAPFFVITPDLGFDIENIASFTPSFDVAAKVSGVEKVATPFGHYENVEDRIFALYTAKMLFGEVKDKEPVARLK